MRSLSTTIAVLLATPLAIGTPMAHAEEAEQPASSRKLLGTNFADLSIEELMNESVSSVSKRETRLSESAAAVAVVTQDDIRRLGITTLPEALRWVPGLDVARISGNQWAVGSRGFNQQFSNKLLVVMDGRTIYDPAFGGVFWDIQDTAMEDIDRIEVIRGPGAALWGANAVNGVINIITKSAKDTQGTMVSTVAGTEAGVGGTIRHGGTLGSDAFYRVYLKGFNRDGLLDGTGQETPDSWDSIRTGFRLDWTPTKQDAVTFQGDYYYGHSGERLDKTALTAPFMTSEDETYLQRGGNLLGRWTRTFSATSQLSFQAYYDRFEHGTLGAYEKRDTADAELQYRFAVGTRHDVTVGTGYRYTTDQMSISPQLSFVPDHASAETWNAFVQDQISLSPKKWSLILGSKVEHNDYTGFEFQPNARLLWTPTETQTLWASASRAVRTPTRVDSDLRFNLAATPATATPATAMSPAVVQTVEGTPGLASEVVMAYEMGYRVQPTPKLSLDLAVFYNRYDKVATFAPGTPIFRGEGRSPFLQVPLAAGNNISGDTYGAELAVQWQVTQRWRLAADYSVLQMELDQASDIPGSSPQQQVRLRSYVQLPWDLEFNSALAYVDELPDQKIPAYLRVDLGLVWRPSASLEVGLWGQNLLDNSHPEFANVNGLQRTEIPRSVQLKVTWSF